MNSNSLCIKVIKDNKYVLFAACFFLAGFILTHNLIDNNLILYAFFSIMCIFSSSLLLSLRKESNLLTIPIWLVFVLFLSAFFFKFYYLLLEPEHLLLTKSHVNRKIYNIMQNQDNVYSCFETTTMSFVSFCITGWILMKKAPIKEPVPNYSNFDYYKLNNYLSYFLPVLILVIGTLLYISGVGVMGRQSFRLPFRMAGWIFYTWTIFLPTLILFFIWSCDVVVRKKHLIYGVILLLIHGVGDMIIRSSRGTLVKAFIVVFFLFLLSKRINRARLSLIVVVFIVTILVFPLISYYRHYRNASPTSSIPECFIVALDKTYFGPTASPIQTLKITLNKILTRYSGVENLYPMINDSSVPLFQKAFNVSISKYYTMDILKYPPNRAETHRSATTLIGWLYIVGGNMMVIIGTITLTLLTWFIWKFICLLKINIREVAKAIIMLWMFLFFIDGIPERPFILLSVIAGSLFFGEIAVKAIGALPATIR